MSNQALKTETQEPTAHQLARDAMEQAGGDVRQAAKLLESWACQNMAVWKAVTADLLAQGCYSAVRGVCRQERRAIWYSPGYDRGGAGDRVKEHARTILDLPLPGGKPLRDATRDDLEAASAFYQRQSEQMARVSAFFDQVASRIKGRKTVGQVLTVEELEGMKTFQ